MMVVVQNTEPSLDIRTYASLAQETSCYTAVELITEVFYWLNRSNETPVFIQSCV